MRTNFREIALKSDEAVVFHAVFDDNHLKLVKN
jgi:hypothetical protein